MRTNRRALWSASEASSSTNAELPKVVSPISFALSATIPSDIKILAGGSKLEGLDSAELKVLRKKQKCLIFTASATLQSLPKGEAIRNALESTLIFAQHEAGTAVCIDATGWILTCSHCFGDSEEDWYTERRKWLLYYTGEVVQVECRYWDPKRDLALIKIIAVEIVSNVGLAQVASFKFMRLSAIDPVNGSYLLCIGQPGAEDMESEDNKPTKYNLFEISEGSFRGLVKGVDPQDNSDIGTLTHDAWTYWGHSGAPLLDAREGTLVGLHSSWDDKTAMRHGIPRVAIEHFLTESFGLPQSGDKLNPLIIS